MAQHKGGIYTPVWEKLKVERTVTLQLTKRSQVSTIIRGIRDTKYRDRAFQLANGDISWFLHNKFNPHTLTLTVTLDSAFDIEGVKES
jgi:hypothetical protein